MHNKLKLQVIVHAPLVGGEDVSRGTTEGAGVGLEEWCIVWMRKC